MNYAIVPINIKQVDNDLFIRCVLVEFKNKEGNFYKGTRFLDCSPYFKDPSKALQYKFEDDGYTLIRDSHGNSDDLRMIKRKYHTCSASLVDERLLGTTFEAESDQEAIEFFTLSVYYDCDSEPMEVGKHE